MQGQGVPSKEWVARALVLPGHQGELPLLEASVPVVGSDTTRMEALGAPLAALLLTGRLDAGPVELHGYSTSVVSLVNQSRGSSDSCEFNCVALTWTCFQG